MLIMFQSLSFTDVIYAALMALIVYQIIIAVSRFLKLKRGTIDVHAGDDEIERKALIKKCMDMFPVETIYFRGKVFSKGMKIRITTFQNRMIEGELIGKNEMDILCIFTGRHIVAHEISKIEDIIEMPLKTGKG